jgi:small conductance mechanosensitive channel
MDTLLQRLDTIDWARWSGPALSGARILLILLGAWIAIAVLQRVVRAVRVRVAERIGGADAARRAETLGRVVRYLIAVGIGAVAAMLILGELGVSLAPILGAAGVVGLAIGFGAQSLVKDYFTGFFILFEDQLRTGDVVKIDDIGGLVEDVTLRHVQLRDYDGNVHFIPNGLITVVTNMSRTFAQAVIDVGVAYRESVDDALAVMREVGARMRADAVFGPKILDDLEIAGVERLDPSAVVLRCRFKVVPLEQWSVRREFFRRVKAAFEARGIEIPYPHLTVYAGVDRHGAAPPFRLHVGHAAGGADGASSEPPAAPR